MAKIVTYTGSDINPELAQQSGITAVPLYLGFGEKVCPRVFRIGAALGVQAGPGVLLVALREGKG